MTRRPDPVMTGLGGTPDNHDDPEVIRCPTRTTS
jgi:hypothetical protein